MLLLDLAVRVFHVRMTRVGGNSEGPIETPISMFAVDSEIRLRTWNTRAPSLTKIPLSRLRLSMATRNRNPPLNRSKRNPEQPPTRHTKSQRLILTMSQS